MDEDTDNPTARPAARNTPAELSWSAVYDELKRLAHLAMANEKTPALLRTTSLVHEAFLRLEGGGPVQWNSKGHFFSAAAQAMRRILVDEARRRKTQKRGQNRLHVALDDAKAGATDDAFDVIDLDDALEVLAKLDARAAQVVELRFFAGNTLDETAALLGTTVKDVKKDWDFARAWLHRRLCPAG